MKSAATRQRVGLTFLALGMAFFVAVRLGFLGTVILDRPIPVEPDDAYSYIVKASLLGSCFLQRCPALEDLRAQTTAPSSDPSVSNSRFRQYTRTLFQYHLPHSTFLLALNSAGVSWERAYAYVQYAGLALLGIAAGYFLYAIWGAGAAGIAMFLLALTLFRGQGMHAIVPSNLVLGIALALWAGMALEKRHPVLVLGCIAAMLAMHPIGRLYSVATLLLLAVWTPRPWTPGNWAILGAGAGLVAIASSLGFIFDRPALSMRPFWNMEVDYSLTHAILDNTRAGHEILQAWVNRLGGRFEAAFVVLLGFIALPKEKRFNAFTLTAVLAGMWFLGFGHAMPGYPGITVIRLWIPLGLLLTGAVGYVAWRIMEIAAGGMRRSGGAKFRELASTKFLVTPRGWMTGAMAAIALLLALSFAAMAFNGLNFLRSYNEILRNADNLAFDTAQPAKLLAMSKPGDAILYTDELRLYYFLTHGAGERGAVFLNAVMGTDLEKSWIAENESLRYAVAANPIFEGSIKLDGGKTVEIAGLTTDSSALLISNKSSREGHVDITVPDSQDAGRQVTLNLPPNQESWLPLGATRTVRVRAGGDSATLGLRLKGIRETEGQTTHWPWNSEITLREASPRPGRTGKPVGFKLKWTDTGFEDRLKVFDDTGSTVMMKIVSRR